VRHGCRDGDRSMAVDHEPIGPVATVALIVLVALLLSLAMGGWA
jgi:hypothetical protein